MKVIHINTTDDAGGAALAMYRLHQTLKRDSVDSRILVGRKFTNNPEVGEIQGYMDIPHLNRYIDKYKLRDICFTKKTDLFSNKEYLNADVIHLNNIHGGYFDIRNLEKLCNEKPVIWTFHDMWPLCGNKPHTFGDMWWAEDKDAKAPTLLDSIMFNRKKKVYSNCKFKIVVPSLWLYNLAKQSILKNFEISVIPNAVDTNVIKPLEKETLRKKYGIDQKKKVISFISHGGLKNKWKGGEYMQKALAILGKKYDLLFLEIGVKGSQVEKQPNCWKIPFTSDRKILNEYLNLSDVFLFTSLAENFPLVLLEAQSAGIPVVTFDVGGSKEIVNHLSTGYVAGYKDIEDTVKGVCSILDDEKLHDKYAKNARINVLEKFTLEQQRGRYIKLYKEAIDEFN